MDTNLVFMSNNFKAMMGKVYIPPDNVIKITKNILQVNSGLNNNFSGDGKG